ncbi:PREDICTED: uncharacterized protein LOC109243684 isoform X2 [Nicotiana attenuata]|uniref:uncharacterized protein LOC109243684 isoform X2 n=1 Tax=Nicotiana attenuata TaxID=49451 RepID=UPI000904AECD|nr:PREDICTED: uncharacterized protein LOC109243684 isoform X2 [Nicotiana attenuata]
MANGMNKPFERPTTPSIRISQGQACFTAQTDTHLQHTLLKTIMEVMMDHQAMSGMDLQAPMELKCLNDAGRVCLHHLKFQVAVFPTQLK